MEPIFSRDQQVRGMKIFEFIDWANLSLSSQDAIDGDVLGIPPLQRSVLWRPQQILDLWDSVLRELPIGSILLQEREGGRLTRRAGETVTEPQHGFDLLDGQQRAIALLLGWIPTEKDKFLWIDFSQPAPKLKTFALYLTAKAQPFGYKPNGDRRGVDDRRKARELFDKENENKFLAKYDHELFDLPELECWRQKPKPFGTKHAIPFDMALQDCREASETGWLVSCKDHYGLPLDKSHVRESVECFHIAVGRIRKSEIALIKVDIAIKEENLRLLFDRVGQNGTVLSNDERLYSIFKQSDPYVYDAVQDLCETGGHILSPPKIVVAAIRCSFIATDDNSNKSVVTPSPEGFERLLKIESFNHAIRKLIPERNDCTAPCDIAKLCEVVVSVLEFRGDNDNGLPSVLFPAFGNRLYEILIFWLFSNCSNDIRRAREITEKSRDELLRFVLFWLVFIENADRGADCALMYLISKKCECFPGKAVYGAVVKGDWRGGNARTLIDKEKFAEAIAPDRLTRLRQRDRRFRNNADDDDIRLLVNRFWWGKETVLPWIQRRYLETKFAGYRPLRGYADEVPFDYDHICPQAEVGYWPVTEWRDRDFLRDSIGNFWILHGSLNRSLGACVVKEKMSGSRIDPQDQPSFNEARTEAFGTTLHTWTELDASNGQWSDERGATFQFAVENRTVWLYARFYDELRFHEWLEGGTP